MQGSPGSTPWAAPVIPRRALTLRKKPPRDSASSDSKWPTSSILATVVVSTGESPLHSTAPALHVLDDFAHMFGKLCESPSSACDSMCCLDLPRLQPSCVFGYRASAEGCALTRRNAASNPALPHPLSTPSLLDHWGSWMPAHRVTQSALRCSVRSLQQPYLPCLLTSLSRALWSGRKPR